MSKRFTQVVVLAEDERSANLLRRYVLRAMGIDNRRIRQEISPSGEGDAKPWVLGRYPIEVKQLRRGHTKRGLVVHLDADTETVARRAMELAAALKTADEGDRNADEQICHAIPRRQTETWLCILTGTAVDEERDCKRDRVLANFDKAVTTAAEALFEFTRANAPAPPLPSLATAAQELRRLET
jgi:hypothetical protein